jgi:hypothetical protein
VCTFLKTTNSEDMDRLVDLVQEDNTKSVTVWNMGGYVCDSGDNNLERETPMAAFVSFETLYSKLRPGNFMSLSRIWPTFKLEPNIVTHDASLKLKA